MSQRRSDEAAGWPLAVSPPQSPLSPLPNHNSPSSHGDEDESDFEVFAYRASESSGHDSPEPDQPPRLPSPSNESSVPESSGSPPKSVDHYQDESERTKEVQFAAPVSRHALAQRLARIARRLATTTEDELPVDPLLVTEQVNQLEMTLLGILPPNSPHGVHQKQPQAPTTTSTTALPLRLRPTPKSQRTPPSHAAVTETAAQLSKDLETLHNNLRARHEEATHIHTLLLSRLELAAQRILFLQRHAEDLESQLRDNDDELGHLRVLLKALQLQVPEHPDEDLRKCLVRVREEFWAVRKRREALRQRSFEDNIG